MLLQAIGPDGLTLQAEFIWQGDRFGHVISALPQPGQRVPLLESIEGTTADVWPPSPPLQSLRIEEFSLGRRAALLVGMAGRSHWSASVEPVQGEAALIFDIACRCSDAASVLGIRYRSRLRTIGANDSNDMVSIEPEPIPGQITTISQPTPGEYLIQPQLDGAHQKTWRWKYRVQPALKSKI